MSNGKHRFPGSRIIAWAARVVPPARRAAWRAEWEAEAAYAWTVAQRRGGGGLRALRLRIRVSTCTIDALWVRREAMETRGWLKDLRIALRGLARNGTFTLVTVLTLALGIGANTAVFTIVDGVLLSPLPFERPERLVSIEHLGRDGQDELPVSPGLYLLYRERASSLEEIAMFTGTAVNVVTEAEPERVQAQMVTPGFFDVLRVGPALGRGFTEAEGLPDGEQVVILSDGLWRTSFGADPGVLDRTLDVNGTNRRIVGVMPPEFGHPDREARLWLPYVVDPSQAPLASFQGGGIARMANGSDAEGVLAEFQGLIHRLPELFPEAPAVGFLGRVGLRAQVRPLKEAVVGDVSSTLWILLGSVGVVLLIACANVANLLLVRAEARGRELALRMALGAGWPHVLRAFMSESLILAAAGGVLGTLIAAGAVRAVFGLLPTDLPRMAEIGVDVRVLGFTAALSLGCAVFFGLFPLQRARARDLAGRIRDASGHGAGTSVERHRLRSGLVVAQVALALVLLVGAGLMLRTFQALRALDPGFDAGGVLTAELSVPPGEMEGWQETAGFFRTLGDRLRVQPRIEAVGFAMAAPLSGGLPFFNLSLEDHPRAQDELPILAWQNFVEVGYFEAMDIGLVEGRTFQPGDGAEGVRAAVVSRGFAERWWPGQNAMGRRISLGGPEWSVIVGVVEDARYASLEEPAPEMVYWTATSGPAESPQPTRTMDVVIRTSADPLEIVPVLRREVEAVNPRIPISNPRSMEDVVETAGARTSFTMTLLGSASGIALLLGLVGIYGVVSYIVTQRTREIGVRMALGATAPSVRGMVVKQGLAMAAVGAVLGLVAAGALGSLMESVLFGVQPTDPLTYASVALALVAVCVLATWIPAARAARVDPSTALRSE
jgi:predicted permease